MPAHTSVSSLGSSSTSSYQTCVGTIVPAHKEGRPMTVKLCSRGSFPKQVLSDDAALTRFNPALEVGISCDASDEGICQEKATSTDHALKNVMEYMHHSWPKNIPDKLKAFFTLRDSLTVVNVCLLKFQTWCAERGVKHLHRAPYRLEMNGAAERLVQTFNNSPKMSDLPPGDALQEFLMHYRRTPLAGGISPSKLLNGPQICTKLDIIIPVQRPTPARVHK
ncbi:hypothetical protein EGW08_023770 [Elysia chlorotica]|uniref:Integrase catalytic domain-containing protein n=1 Tax=Elysia chlorotica TaxID=188477 RepID=A0A3S1AZX5_ELYCH|nr:hypothetical protein EGW08_023770 [Elysia chlorotica]